MKTTSTITNLEAVLLLLGLLVGFWLVVAVGQVIGALVFPCWLLWELRRAPRYRAIHRARQKRQQRRIDTLIRMQLIAHGLQDNHANRVRVLQALCAPAKRRRKP